MTIFFSVVSGAVMGWLFAWIILWAQVTKSCPTAIDTQCEYFGNQKICLVGEK